MFTALTNLIPGKAIIIIIGILLVCTGGYLYYSKTVAEADLKAAQVELAQAKDQIKLQQDTITQIQHDAQVQKDLLDQANTALNDIRAQAQANAKEINNTDFGATANANAQKLQDTINQRTQALIDSITKLSQEK